MKKLLVALIFILTPVFAFVAISQEKTFWHGTVVEFAPAYDIASAGKGFQLKGKKEILVTQHFDGLAGLSLQFNHADEMNIVLFKGYNGFNQDYGVFFVTDWLWYPFKKRRFFAGNEIFIGSTTLISEGRFELPAYDIDEKYSNKYTYFNYGISPSLGWNFGEIRASLFFMASLKGLLDSGEQRLIDSDSKVYLGINLCYRFTKR